MIRILFVIPYKEGEAVVQEVLAEKAYKKQIQYETLVAGVGERLTISQDVYKRQPLKVWRLFPQELR